MPKAYINPDALASTLELGFSQAVAASGRRILYMSGQTAWNAERQIVGGADVARQARQAFENVRRLVEAAGGSAEDVVSLRIYVVGSLPEHANAIGAALREFFPAPNAPAT